MRRTVSLPGVDNQTVYPTRTVKAIVNWVAKELELDGKTVYVRVGHANLWGAYKGRFYPRARSRFASVYKGNGEYSDIEIKIPDGYAHLAICRIGKPGTYPRGVAVYRRKDSPDPWVCMDWKEALVGIVAHELMHARQFLQPQFSRNNPGRFNEVETEWAACRLTRRWREKEAKRK